MTHSRKALEVLLYYFYNLCHVASRFFLPM